MRAAIIACAVALALACTLTVPRVLACGGPEEYPLGSRLTPVPVSEIWAPWQGYDTVYRDELLFLYPFRVAAGEAYEPLWHEAYGWPFKAPAEASQYVTVALQHADGTREESRQLAQSWSFGDDPTLVAVTVCSGVDNCRTTTRRDAGMAVDTAPFDAALRAHDWRAGAAAAQAVVERILDMPQPIAQQQNAALRRAVEFLELAPYRHQLDDAAAAAYFLAWSTGDPLDPSVLPPVFKRAAAIRAMPRAEAARVLAEDPAQPRAPSLRFVLIQQALREQIPDGWSPMPAETAARLDAMIDAWLRDYPQHPLHELVALQRVRVRYFSERGAPAAVAMLLDVYPRHPQRVLTDLRYILFNRSPRVPLSLLEQRQPFDPVLLTAMLPGYVTLERADWTRLWRLSEAHPEASWALNLQERLLVAASDMAPLPDGYPDTPARPSELWARLRLAELAARGDWHGVLAQAAMVTPDAVVAQIAAAAHLALGETAAALQVPHLPADERAFLLDTLLTDDELEPLLNGSLGGAAALTLGIRRAAAGDWGGAAAIVAPSDAARAARWRVAAALAADRSPSGRLRWARYLTANRGRLFRPTDTAWERSIGLICARVNWEGAPRSVVPRWTTAYQCDAGRRQIEQSEAWLALQAYADYLATASRSATSRQALREADAVYNWLLNHCQNCWDFWPQFLEQQPAVATLRRAGERVRGRSDGGTKG